MWKERAHGLFTAARWRTNAPTVEMSVIGKKKRRIGECMVNVRYWE